MDRNCYSDPLAKRYASRKMLYIFSDQYKFSSWRKLWVALAEGEKELGIPISDSQIEEMKKAVNNIDFEKAEQYEKETRHDVMAHIHTFGDQCPSAKPIIHLGATSAFVGDNTDIIQIRDALLLIQGRLINVINSLKEFCLKYKNLPTMGFTHLQPAQPTTVGKRATLWLQDLVMDFSHLSQLILNLRLRGIKGTTGTQASFLNLFNNDHNKVLKLDKLLCKAMGFEKSIAVTGQTYPRKTDGHVVFSLASIAQSAAKFSTDLRLLQHMKEMEEPFGKNQVGSSAMAYKRNPMRAERITSLSRVLMENTQNALHTAANQWMERTLDDSAGRRLYIPQSFLVADAILILYNNIASGLTVYPEIIRKHLEAELPFMATENILMEAVSKGGNRQELHEKIRVHSIEASKTVKEKGLDNDLLDRLGKDKSFNINSDELKELLEPSAYIGRASQQVDEFIDGEVEPLLNEHKNLLNSSEEEIKV